MHPFLAPLSVLWRHTAPVTLMLPSPWLLVALPPVSEFPRLSWAFSILVTQPIRDSPYFVAASRALLRYVKLKFADQTEEEKLVGFFSPFSGFSSPSRLPAHSLPSFSGNKAFLSLTYLRDFHWTEIASAAYRLFSLCIWTWCQIST